jgi:hypothetical protein
MTLSTLINKRREVHEADDNGAGFVRSAQSDLDQQKRDEQRTDEYRANDLGSGQMIICPDD